MNSGKKFKNVVGCALLLTQEIYDALISLCDGTITHRAVILIQSAGSTIMILIYFIIYFLVIQFLYLY
jgi:hypothetical protein